ncbi:MAG: class I SAM-dependent methyltransferase [Sphingomonadales bacterium]|nr:MAG: class I SAM-dependent methyltransferase [Sphingomonadales bacterium]
MNQTDAALLELLETLYARDYRFVTPTPATHARVVARPGRRTASCLEDVLGWSLPFAPDLLDGETLRLLRAGDAVEPAGEGLLRATIRGSSLKGRLYLHSAYPTHDEDAVFFGPDSYRFADLIEAELGEGAGHIVDIGTGAGVGAIVAGRLRPEAKITMTDINPKALRLAAINARAAGVAALGIEGDGLSGVEDPIDVALANPPYIIDETDRTYRNGGAMLGAQVSLDMVRMALDRLVPGGRVILYTGSAIVDGRDGLREALEGLGATLQYREIDPDVFGEELDEPAYSEVDRIALVAAILTK